MTENKKSYKIKADRPLDIFDTETDSFKIFEESIKQDFGNAVCCVKYNDEGRQGELKLNEYGIIKLDNFPPVTIPMDNPYLCDKYGRFGKHFSLEQFAHVYRKISENHWNLTDRHYGEPKTEYGKAVLKFMDENIFNTPERKQILEDYMHKNWQTEKHSYEGYDVTLQRESESHTSNIYDDVYDKEYSTTRLTYDINDKKDGRYILEMDVCNNSIGVYLYKDEVKYDNNIITSYVDAYRPKLDKLEDIMDVYKRVHNGEWETFNDKGDYAGPIAQAKNKSRLLRFMDKYLFNTPESRELLNEHLNQPTFEEYNIHRDREYAFRKNLEEKVEAEKNPQSPQVESKLRKLGKKIEKSKLYRTIAGNPKTAGALAGAAIFVTGMALSDARGPAGIMEDGPSDAKKVRTDAPKPQLLSEENGAIDDVTMIKSGIQGPEYIIDHVKVAVSRNYLEKNHLLHNHNSDFVIYPDDLIRHLQEDNVFAALESRKQGSFGSIYTPEERKGTIEKIEEFAIRMPTYSFKQNPLLQMLADKAQFVLTITHDGVVRADIIDMQHQSVANASSNKEKIEKMRKNQEDKPMLLEFATEKNPDGVYYENAKVNCVSFQLVSKADERTAPANTFMDVLRAQKGDSGKNSVS